MIALKIPTSGDPGNVMIFGESAGGSSVGMHLLMPQSWNLYHKVFVILFYFNVKLFEIYHCIYCILFLFYFSRVVFSILFYFLLLNLV